MEMNKQYEILRNIFVQIKQIMIHLNQRNTYIESHLSKQMIHS